jgi:hypothetical protein
VKLIFKMAVGGAGYGAIAKHLNKSGIPSPDAKRKRAGVRVPGRWVSGSVLAILISPVYIGTVKSRPRVINGKEVSVPDPRYVCNGTLRNANSCRQVPIPRDGFERAVLRILDEELLSEPALVRLEKQMRRIVAARNARPKDDGIPALEKREKHLAARVTDGARRLLEVDADLVPDVRKALAEVKADLESVRESLAARRRALRPITNAEDLVARTLASFRSMATLLRDPSVPLERRREVLRRLLPKRGDERPIQVHIDPKAKKGWRHALKRVVVRHLGIDAGDDEPASRPRSFGFVVSPAGAAEAEQPDALKWDLAEALPTWERELVAVELEEVGELVGAGVRSSRWRGSVA